MWSRSIEEGTGEPGILSCEPPDHDFTVRTAVLPGNGGKFSV